MRTPKEYSGNLKNKIITEEMLADALHSVNKRAKNWRDKKREYKHYFSAKYFYSAQEQESRMYEKKEKLLRAVPIQCIHREHGGYEKIRTYDTEGDYLQKYTSAFLRGSIVWENSYYDYHTDDFVCFFDVFDYTSPIYRYYLYHTVYGHGFHTPIEEGDISKYECQIVDIDYLLTQGESAKDLLSVQFVDKVIGLIESGDYTYVPAAEAPEVQIKRNPVQEAPDMCLVDECTFQTYWNLYGCNIENLVRGMLSAQTVFPDVMVSDNEKTAIREWVLDMINKPNQAEKTIRKTLKREFKAAYRTVPCKADYKQIYAYLQNHYTSDADLYGLILENVTDQFRENFAQHIVSNKQQEIKKQYARETAEIALARKYPKKHKKKKNKNRNGDVNG